MEAKRIKRAILSEDPEFGDELPPLTPEAFEILERSILDEGIRDPIVVWTEGNVIVDGYNRYAIAKRHDLYFEINPIPFRDRAQALDWLRQNALGRRNLTPEPEKSAEMKCAHCEPISDEAPEFPKERTAEKLAKEHGVSPATVRRDGELAEAIEALKAVDLDVERNYCDKKIRRGRIIRAAGLFRDIEVDWSGEDRERMLNEVRDELRPRERAKRRTKEEIEADRKKEKARILEWRLESFYSEYEQSSRATRDRIKAHLPEIDAELAWDEAHPEEVAL